MENNQSYETPPLKRLFDIVTSLAILAVLSPIFLLILVLIVIENLFRERRLVPLFYTETRYSESKPFKLIKFNIFKQSKVDELRAESVVIETKQLEHNNGISWIGFLLKQIYFDEFPQILNVLLGSMSIVGPRPVNQNVFAKLNETGESAKLRVRAGMTGPFQSYKGLEGKTDSELDQYYLDYCLSHSPGKVVLHDLVIIFRTMKVVLKAQGI